MLSTNHPTTTRGYVSKTKKKKKTTKINIIHELTVIIQQYKTIAIKFFEYGKLEI